jgi:hypothetical protein
LVVTWNYITMHRHMNVKQKGKIKTLYFILSVSAVNFTKCPGGRKLSVR